MPTLKRIRARINKKHFGEVEIFWDGLEIFWLIDIFLVGGGGGGEGFLGRVCIFKKRSRFFSSG